MLNYSSASTSLNDNPKTCFGNLANNLSLSPLNLATYLLLKMWNMTLKPTFRHTIIKKAVKQLLKEINLPNGAVPTGSIRSCTSPHLPYSVLEYTENKKIFKRYWPKQQAHTEIKAFVLLYRFQCCRKFCGKRFF